MITKTTGTRKVHIWCPRVSDGALAIRDALRAKGIVAHKTWADQTQKQLRVFLSRVKAGDLWINWGTPWGKLPYGVKALNSATFLNKKTQLLKLAQKDVPCLEVSDYPKQGFIGRSINHQGGYDLLHNTGRDFYTKKMDFDREVRIHIYKGVSIHAGLKVPRAGVGNPHPWIRAYDSGWRIDYSKAESIAQNRRDLAKSAVAALGLDFGAVDIGVVKGKKAYVLEINTAPGLDEGPSVDCYVQKFIKELNV